MESHRWQVVLVLPCLGAGRLWFVESWLSGNAIGLFLILFCPVLLYKGHWAPAKVKVQGYPPRRLAVLGLELSQNRAHKRDPYPIPVQGLEAQHPESALALRLLGVSEHLQRDRWQIG